MICLQNARDQEPGQYKENLHPQRAIGKLIAVVLQKYTGMEMKYEHHSDQPQRVELRFITESLRIVGYRTFSSH